MACLKRCWAVFLEGCLQSKSHSIEVSVSLGYAYLQRAAPLGSGDVLLVFTFFLVFLEFQSALIHPSLRALSIADKEMR